MKASLIEKENFYIIKICADDREFYLSSKSSFKPGYNQLVYLHSLKMDPVLATKYNNIESARNFVKDNILSIIDSFPYIKESYKIYIVNLESIKILEEKELIVE
jgi:hypothetical protein